MFAQCPPPSSRTNPSSLPAAGALFLTVCCALSVTQLLFPGDLLGRMQEFDRSWSARVVADGVWRKAWDYADTLQNYFKK